MKQRKQIIINITKEFFQNLEKKMPQTQALSFALENNLPKIFEEKKEHKEPKSPNEIHNEQTRFKFNSLIELQKLKNTKEELRHKNIMEEIKALSKANIKVYVRGDYRNDFDEIQKEIRKTTRRERKPKKK